MNPNENTTTTEPQDNSPQQFDAAAVQNDINNAPVAGVTQQVDAQPSATSLADTISPEQPASMAQAQPTPPTEAPALSGVVNATSPITENVPSEPTAEDPGRTIGIIGLVLAILIPLIGLVVSIVARSKSKKAGHKNGLALAGIFVSLALIVVTIVGTAFFVFGATNFCKENGTGTHTTEDGVIITCK